MAERYLFDDIARVLASPISRRKAFGWVARALAGVALVKLWPGRATAAQAGDVEALPVRDFVAPQLDAFEVIRRLREDFGAPVSFVEAARELRVDIAVAGGTVADVLAQLTAQAPAYRWKSEGGRLVVAPDLPALGAVVDGVAIAGVPRLEAATRYIDAAKAQVPGTDDLLGVLMLGSPDAPVFVDPVTLSRRSTVLGHFVEILGDDPSAAFSVLRTRTGGYAFSLDAVTLAHPLQRLLPPADPCRPIGVTYANVQKPGCAPGFCGAYIVYDVTAIETCPGDTCAHTLATEKVTSDHGCTNARVNTGGGCRSGNTNAIKGCRDQYALCASPAVFPIPGCTQTLTQEISINGRVVQTCQIVFKIVKDGPAIDDCMGTVTRTCTPSAMQDQCCTVAGNAVLCPPGQICCGDTVCCDTAKNDCTRQQDGKLACVAKKNGPGRRSFRRA